MAGYLDMVRQWEQSRYGPHREAGGDNFDCLENEGQAPADDSSDCAKSVKSVKGVGDGEAPPLDRSPLTEQGLRRWMDYTADPEVFARWLEWAMNYTDTVEDSPCPEDTPSG